MNIAKIIQKQQEVYWIITDKPKEGADNNTNYSIKDSRSFDYKTIIAGKLEVNNTENEVEIVVPLKHLSNFWRTLNIPLINLR